jgi:antitoxin (DNA-binding transcriptional repressor) of toxin-antitoxin stability system
MKTVELTLNKAADVSKEAKAANDQTIILTLGNKPVAALLPMAEKIAHLSQFEQVIPSEESVTLTIGGRPIAILQPLVPLVLVEDEDADLETVALSTNPQFLELIERSRQRHQKEGGISSDEMRRRLGL